MASPTPFRLVTAALALVALAALPALAAMNSAPAPVMMVATMPPAFKLQAGPVAVTGATGSVQAMSAGNGRLIIRGQVRGVGRAVVRIPISLAANTRSFVVQAMAANGTSEASVYLVAPGAVTRRASLRGQVFLAMATARDHGHEFFALDHPLPSSLEIVFENLPPGQTRTFSLLLSMRDLGY